MTATGASDQFEVIVTRDRMNPSRLHYQTARVRRPEEDGDHLELLGDLTSPECTRRQAEELALAWLRSTRPQPVSADAVRFVWGVAEPGAGAGRTVGGMVRYAAVRRPRLFGRRG
jgi:hypothetical protein